MKLDHSIHLESIRNARELGGYLTADGRRVRDGVLLRTACLKGISDRDLLVLKDTYHLGHIVDFRMAMELSDAEDPVVDGADYHHLNVMDPAIFHVRADDDAENDTPDIIASVKLSEQIGAMDGRMYIGFLSSETGRKAYSDFFRILLSADPDHAVLWHCTSGKDRTGLAAMLLLFAFGVDEELIVNDYLLTNEFNAKVIEANRSSLKSQGFDDTFIRKANLVLAAVDEQVIRRSIAWLKKEYGSAIGYIRDGLGITENDIDFLKEKYLF